MDIKVTLSKQCLNENLILYFKGRPGIRGRKGERGFGQKGNKGDAGPPGKAGFGLPQGSGVFIPGPKGDKVRHFVNLHWR